MRSYFSKLFFFFDRPAKIRMAGLFVLMFVVTLLEMLGLSLIFPLMEVLRSPDSLKEIPVLKNFYSNLFAGDLNQILWVLCFGVSAAYILKNLLFLVLIYLQNRFVKSRMALMSHQLLSGYLHLPYTFHLARNSAELLRNIENSVTMVFNKSLLPMLYLAMDCMVMLGLLAILFVVDPASTLAIVVLLACGLAFFYALLKKRMKGWVHLEHGLFAEVYKWINQSISGFKEIKVLGREKFFSDNFSRVVMSRAKNQILYGTAKQSPRVFFEVLIIFAMFAVFLITFLEGKPLSSAITVIAMFAVATFRLFPLINRVAASALEIKSSGPVLNVLYIDFKMIAEAKIIEDKTVRQGSVISFRENIRFENIGFNYPDTEASALKNINLEISRGDFMGIVGATGAGKTTLVDVLLGLLTPNEGRLLVDGRDMHENLRDWRSRIGYVPQKIYLNDDTLRRNIAFGVPDEEIDEEKIRKTLGLAYLEDFVAGLEDGLDTRLGDRGVRLSGGEGQRIGIARALYHDPEILIMDEATSSLDNNTEYQISKAIQGIAHKKTLVVIAHRLSTIQKCDRLVLMAAGGISDVGKFDELVARNPEFRQQVQRGNLFDAGQANQQEEEINPLPFK